jgi:hypothetical protein
VVRGTDFGNHLPTELHAALPVQRTRSYIQRLKCMLYASVFQLFLAQGTIQAFEKIGGTPYWLKMTIYVVKHQ